MTAGRLWRLFKQGKLLTVGGMGWFWGGHQSSSCPEMHLGDLLRPFPAQEALLAKPGEAVMFGKDSSCPLPLHEDTSQNQTGWPGF